MQQEVFSFHKTDSLNWSDFIESESNAEAVLYLKQWPNWLINGLIIHGEHGVGKTHLLSLWAQHANAVYILKESLNHHPRFLFDSDCHFIIDDFDTFLTCDNFDWMFHFLNISKEQNRFILLASSQHPSEWKISLKDLKSRLNTLHISHVKPPDDDLLLKIIQKIAKDYDVFIPLEAVEYILMTCERKVATIVSILKILDKLSLQSQKPITLNFVKRYVHEKNI